MTDDQSSTKEQFMANERHMGDTTADQQHDDHGHSVAGWTGASVIVLGALLIGLGIALSHEWLWMVGWAVVAIGAATGFVLSRAGFGHRRLPVPMDHDEWVARHGRTEVTDAERISASSHH